MPGLAPALQTTYEALLAALCRDPSADKDRGLVGKTVRGNRFYYRQHRGADGVRRETYIGPQTRDLLERARRQQQALAAERARRALVQALVRARAVPPVPVGVGRVLAALANGGLFRPGQNGAGATLIGATAMRAYGPMLGTLLTGAMLADAEPSLVTVALAPDSPPLPPPPLLDLLHRMEPSFVPVLPPHDPPEAYVSDKRRLTVAFPAASPARRLLHYLVQGAQPGAILYAGGILVRVPDPARYAWARLLAPPGDTRHFQASTLFAALAQHRPQAIVAAWHALPRAGKPETALAALQTLDPKVRDAVLALIG
jgi:hypothetical protein